MVVYRLPQESDRQLFYFARIGDEIMKFKCEQCGTVFEDRESCPVCGAEAEAPVTVNSERKPFTDKDRDAFWQEVKYSGSKTESDK